jgi:two-component system cell cycle sensor histidine kinase/response regulator CckA
MATILAVDDNSTNRESLVSLLSQFEHRVMQAGDGLQGLEIVHSDRPDLIIADVLMPTMNGFEFVAKLRRDPSTSHIPVIFYSATFLTDELRDLARASGVSWVLLKPSEPGETRRIVGQALISEETIAPPAPSEEAQIKVVQILNNKLFDRNRMLGELNSQLELRVEERTSEILAMNHRLQEQIVEREKVEKQIFQLQKLDAIGRLAGGVAHDFNNLLGVILGESEILLHCSRDEAIVHGLEMIRDSARRGADLTRQLLAFGRRQVLEPRVLNLNTVVEDLKTLLRRLIGEDIELDFQADPNLRNVKADPSQIEQVIMNLALNARDAMPQGGKLKIITANVSLDESYVDRRLVVRPGSYVQLVVSDTGCGMDELTRARTFEPFFTTKEQGKGTGLGLAMVYGIIKQSGGNIWVYSEPGHGTAFKVYLPVVESHVQAKQSVEPTEALPVGSETILLVEDDSSLREVTCQFLQSSGYRVIEASSPQEALRVAEEHQGGIDFLLTDVILPRMNGRELAIQLTAKWPRINVLYVSGYTDGIVRDGAHGVLEEGLAFLQKPYSRRALIRKVREVLDSGRVESVADKH